MAGNQDNFDIILKEDLALHQVAFYLKAVKPLLEASRFHNMTFKLLLLQIRRYLGLVLELLNFLLWQLKLFLWRNLVLF